MQTIIQNKLSKMLDELLEKALEEKPQDIESYETYYEIYYEYLLIDYDKKRDKYYIRYITNDTDNIKQLINYSFLLTEYQKEMINKIFNKWSKENDG